LNNITGHINKGGVQLPDYRCARGTTFLESFHLHLARYVCAYIKNVIAVRRLLMHRFIPGSSASDVHFQMYLLEGLSRWNQACRLTAAVQACENIQPGVCLQG